MKTLVLPCAAAEHQFLFEWLERGARRMHVRDCLREGGWMFCILLSSFGLYLLCETLHLPSAVLVALSPLMVLGTGAVAVFFGRRCARRPDLSAVAAEADASCGLQDELKSAYWFARRGAPSAWEALMLRRAAQRTRGLDPCEIFPLRLPGSCAAAAALATIILALALSGYGAKAPVGSGTASVGDDKAEARASTSAAAAHDETAFGSAAMAAPSSRLESQRAGELWSRAQALVQSLKNTEEQADLQRAVQARDVNRVRELLERAEQEVRAAPAGPDARARAGQVSAEVAQGLLERLQMLLGEGSEPKPGEARPASALEGAVAGSRDDGTRETERRDTDQHTTMDALNDALRALSQAATGDRSMANSPPGQTPQNNGRTNINGGAMGGMRVNTSQAGEGGEDTPPDAPSEGLGGSVLGKPTARLAAKLQRLDNGTAQGEPAALGSEGGYAATQAQAARVDLTAVEASLKRGSDAALTREQIPIAYRASVKRYFLTEHGKER